MGAFATFVVFAWRDIGEHEIPVEEVARIDRERRQVRLTRLATLRRPA
jgi:cytochrome o ubiquinol oxidase subunit 1